MSTAKQADYILRLANELTGERARYVSQSSVLSEPRNGWTNQEASLLIEDLKAAIEAEKERAKSGAVEGARVTFGYTWRDGTQSQVTGTIAGYKWDGDYEVSHLRVTDLDEVSRTKTPTSTAACVVGRITALTVLGDGDGDREALIAERARLAARIAEIDAALA